MKPIVPMREATTYAVVLTERLTSPEGDPVRSPFAAVNHSSQTDALARLPRRRATGSARPTSPSPGASPPRASPATTRRCATACTGSARSPTSRTTSRPRSRAFGTCARRATSCRTPRSCRLRSSCRSRPQLFQLTGSDGEVLAKFIEQLDFIDFVVTGEMTSPQFYARDDADGRRLPLYRQVWDLAAAPRAEALPF